MRGTANLLAHEPADERLQGLREGGGEHVTAHVERSDSVVAPLAITLSVLMLTFQPRLDDLRPRTKRLHAVRVAEEGVLPPPTGLDVSRGGDRGFRRSEAKPPPGLAGAEWLRTDPCEDGQSVERDTKASRQDAVRLPVRASWCKDASADQTVDDTARAVPPHRKLETYRQPLDVLRSERERAVFARLVPGGEEMAENRESVNPFGIAEGGALGRGEHEGGALCLPGVHRQRHRPAR